MPVPTLAGSQVFIRSHRDDAGAGAGWGDPPWGPPASSGPRCFPLGDKRPAGWALQTAVREGRCAGRLRWPL